MGENQAKQTGGTIPAPPVSSAATKQAAIALLTKEEAEPVYVPLPVAEYRLLPGNTHYQDGVQVKVGNTVFLTKSQAAAWKDKFQLVSLNANPEYKVRTPEEYEALRKKNS